MPEPIKCPRCEEGEIYERSVSYAYSRVVRLPDGSIDYGHADALGDYDTDCWLCLDCGAIVDAATIQAIYEGGDA